MRPQRAMFIFCYSVLFASCFGAGCSGSMKPHEARLQATFDELDNLLDNVPKAAIRYTPTACECPPFEVSTGSRWVRISVTGSDDPEHPVDTLLEKCRRDYESGILKEYLHTLALDSKSPSFCANGTPYWSVEIQEPEQAADP
jgi:hypothetical protein